MVLGWRCPPVLGWDWGVLEDGAGVQMNSRLGKVQRCLLCWVWSWDEDVHQAGPGMEMSGLGL